MTRVADHFFKVLIAVRKSATHVNEIDLAVSEVRLCMNADLILAISASAVYRCIFLPYKTHGIK